jgi:hypothetical protein
VAKYIAVRPIQFAGALAFAPGAQVPADHVERYGYDAAGLVVEVGDDHRGDAPHLVQAAPDTAPPPSVFATHHADPAAAQVEQAQLANAGPPQPVADPKPPAKTTKPSTSQPATGDTTTNQPVTEA